MKRPDVGPEDVPDEIDDELDDMAYDWAEEIVERSKASKIWPPQRHIADGLLNCLRKIYCLEQKEEDIPNIKVTEENQKMLKVQGKPFKCTCGCNVFTEYEPLKYQCNSCQAAYTGEKS